MALFRCGSNSGGGEASVYVDDSTGFTPTTSAFTEITFDFAPTKVFFWVNYNNASVYLFELNVANNAIYYWYNSSSRASGSGFAPYIQMDSSNPKKVKYKAYDSNFARKTYCLAVKE